MIGIQYNYPKEERFEITVHEEDTLIRVKLTTSILLALPVGASPPTQLIVTADPLICTALGI
jgi:hypothetical protein